MSEAQPPKRMPVWRQLLLVACAFWMMAWSWTRLQWTRFLFLVNPEWAQTLMTILLMTPGVFLVVRDVIQYGNRNRVLIALAALEATCYLGLLFILGLLTWLELDLRRLRKHKLK